MLTTPRKSAQMMVFIKNNKLVVLGYVSFFAYELSIPNKFQMCGKYGIHYFY